MARVLIIEDERPILDSLRKGLEYQGYAVEAAAAGLPGLDLARQRPPDIVVLDLMLPDLDGLEVCRRLRSMGGTAGILMLTARDHIADRVSGLDAGADDYLVKPFAFDELVARVRALLRRKATQEQQESVAVGDLRIDSRAREVRRGQRVVELTPKEYDLLAHLAANRGTVVSRTALLEQVWGYDFDGDTDTVKVTINHLRAKLNAEGEPDLVQTVRGYGYLLREPP